MIQGEVLGQVRAKRRGHSHVEKNKKQKRCKVGSGYTILEDDLPKTAPIRRADYIKSGIVHDVPNRHNLVELSTSEIVRILGGKPGHYHTVHAARRYPYGKPCINLGGPKSQIIPRIYFSKTIPKQCMDCSPYNHTVKWDYEARFPFGHGPIATDVDDRIIYTMSSTMEEISRQVWNSMKGNDDFKNLCKRGLEFNHASVHVYHKGALMGKHKDRNGVRNSMKEGSAVAVLTLGDSRDIAFHRSYKCPKTGKEVIETNECNILRQEHGSLFILHPDDEVSKGRRNGMLRRMKDASFVHTIAMPKGSEFSVAIIFRCLETTAIVDVTTEKVVPPPPRNAKEARVRRDRAMTRAEDSQHNSAFQLQVQNVQSNWISAMEERGWTNRID